MDDEKIIRELAATLLKRFGLEVECAIDGADAIAKYCAGREAGHPFHLVIMDLTIPGGMGGKEAIKHLLELDPGARAIVSSGYSNDPVMAEFRKYGFCGVVAKPYEIRELAKVLDSVVRSNQRSSAEAAV
jgi:CheY-like chemotaxis protein